MYKKKSTGELSFGIGFSTSAGALLDVGARERNLLGRGQDIKINAELAQTQSSIDFGFTEPYFLDRRLAAGFDLFAINTNYDTSSSSSTYDYNVRTRGGDLRMGYYYNDYLRHDWTYTLSSTEVMDIADDASTYVKDQKGVAVKSSIGHLLTYDRRDSKVDPTEGYYFKFGHEFAGLAGNEAFLKTTVGAGQLFKIDDQSVVTISGTGGTIQGLEGKNGSYQ